MVIRILGSGCKNCLALARNSSIAAKELGMDAEIVKVTDLEEIMSYGVISTPALVVDEKVVSYGKVVKSKEIAKILKDFRWHPK